MLNRITVRGLAMEKLHVAGDFVAEAIAAQRSDLLDRRTIGLETERTWGKAGHRGARLGMRRGTTAAIGGIDPTVGSDDEVIGDEVRISRREATEEDLFLVGLTVTVGIAQPDDVLLGDDDHAVLIDAETRDELEAFMEDDLLVEDAVLLGGNQHADLVLGRSVIITGSEHAALLPGLGVQRTPAIRVLRGFRHPEATTLVPLHGDGLIDEGLGREDADLEAGLHLELGHGIGATTRATRRVADVFQVGLRAKFVGQRAFRRPSGGSGDEGPETDMVQGAGIRTRQEHGRTVTGGFVDPKLGLDVVDGSAVVRLRGLATVVGDLGREGGPKDEDVLVEGQVVDGVVLDIKSGGGDGQRVRIRADAQQHVVRELLALARPGAAKDGLAELGVTGGHGTVDGDDATATLSEGTERLLGVGRIGGELGLVKHHHVGLGQGLGGSDGRLRDLRPTLSQVSDRTAGRLVIIADDEDTQRGGRNEGSRKQK